MGYRITIENLRPQDKVSLIGDGTFDSKVSFNIIADKIIAYNSDGTQSDFVLSGEEIIDTTITDGNDYPETFRCHGAIYAEGYLWCSMRTAGADQSGQPYEMPQILKINPYNLDDYEILYYHSEYTSRSSSSIDQLIYANGYIWFPHSYVEKKLVKLNPSISLSNPSCYEEIDYSSISGNFYNTTIINNNNDSIFMGMAGGLSDSGDLSCINVSMSGRNITFTIPSFNINYDLKTITLLNLYINGYPSPYAPLSVKINNINNSGDDVIINGTVMWINDTDIITAQSSITAKVIGSIIVKFDISNPVDVVVEKVFYIGTSTNLHASMQYGDNVVFTSQSSECIGQISVKIDEYDNCSFGIIPSNGLNLVDLGGGNSIWFGFNRTITDDICCIGNYGYFGNESQPNNTSTIYKFNLITMKNEDAVVVSDVNACFGTFAYNNQIYALFDASPGKITILDTNLNIIQEIILPEGYDSCNEFVVTEDSIYITFWETRPLKVIRIPNLDESGYIVNPQIVIDNDKHIIGFNVHTNGNEYIDFPMLDADNIFDSENGESSFTIANNDMKQIIKYNYPEETFGYPIIKDSVKYDPESYISYDYMVSTARTASFDAYIGKLTTEEKRDFVDSVIKINESDPTINDILICNNYYYSTNENSEKLINITNYRPTVGSELVDGNGISRTISSVEVISEYLSTLMCRIYQNVNGEEILVYAGIINKKDVSYNDGILKISLSDIMYLFTELSKKYSMSISDTNDAGYQFINPKRIVKDYIDVISRYTGIGDNYFMNTFDINYDYLSTENKSYTFYDVKNKILNDDNYGSSFDYSIGGGQITISIPFKYDYQLNSTSIADTYQLNDNNNNFFFTGNDFGYSDETNNSVYLEYPYMRVRLMDNVMKYELWTYRIGVNPFSETQTETSGFVKYATLFQDLVPEQVVQIFDPFGQATSPEKLQAMYDLILYRESTFNNMIYTVNKLFTGRTISLIMFKIGDEYSIVSGYDGTSNIDEIKSCSIENTLSFDYNFNTTVDFTNYSDNKYSDVVPLYSGEDYYIYDIILLFSSLLFVRASTDVNGMLIFKSINDFEYNRKLRLDFKNIYKPYSINSIESDKDTAIFDNIYIGENGLKSLFIRTRNNITNFLYEYKGNNKLYKFNILNNELFDYDSGLYFYPNLRDRLIINPKENDINLDIYITKITPKFNGQVLEIEGKSI